MIPISRISGTAPVPFAYQQKAAGIGESKVMAYQRIM